MSPAPGSRRPDGRRPDDRRFDGPHFDELYAADEDPWRVRTDWYERRKRALALASLPRETYPRALEVGCSTGVMTAELARRCARLTALDASATAVRLAREEVARADDRAGDVAVLRARVPEQLPQDVVDLVVVSEVGYFLAPADLDELLARLPEVLAPGADLLAVHWRRDGETLAVPGDEVHRRLAGLEALGAQRLVAHVEEPFLLDVWRWPGA
ncbi:class I SAM-dependent methyltransferase [uncultured Pseudokineococcus sp.]|uniref:methyltransferase domain-containing protein n=1 Tax=uncultured Pseudokineococcus sp. TaxID=1642928 RepID=UPI002618B651|nr:class I SAM-dependent methyltransferase [uncultured Pseudokineococcus sp.]